MPKKKSATKIGKKKKGAAQPYQVAALPVRRGKSGELQILILTSRETRRWIIPKGWPKKGIEDCIAAALEAREEAGLLGVVQKRPFGSYRTFKRLDSTFQFVVVNVFRFDVIDQLEVWPEKSQRVTRWVNMEQAVALIDEPGLLALLATLQKASRKRAAAAPGMAPETAPST